MAKGKQDSTRVDLTRALELLRSCITQALCAASFQHVRTDERQRDWTLWTLVQFWVAVVLRAPPSLRHALAEAREGREPLAEPVKTSDQAFFQRVQGLSWKFFGDVFRRFLGNLLPRIQPRYCRPLHSLRERFTDVLLIDGSRIAKVAHRLKILWDQRAVVLPGCLIATYDLFRGVPHALDFCADAARAEMTRAIEAVGQIARGTLIVGDRLFCVAKFFEELRQKGLWGLFRRNRLMRLKRLHLKPSRKHRWMGGILTEWRVRAGTGATAPAQTLRLIRFKKGRRVYELLTNVLDPDRLTAEEAMLLYPKRWTIERMFFDLKVVLNLNRVYAANPNAVGLQVYAATMVYATMRVAQAEAAHNAGIEPEDVSSAKLFPKVAAACHDYVVAEWTVEEMIRLNPGKRLRRPRWKGRRFMTIDVQSVLRMPRNGKRRHRKYCKARRHWKSFTHVPGGKLLTN